MQSRQTVPTEGNTDYESYRRRVNRLMARWGFAQKRHKGSTSWRAGNQHADATHETLFKLCYFGPGEVGWGIRREFADRNDKLAALRWPLQFAVQPSPVAFVGFTCVDEATAMQRIEKILTTLGEPLPEHLVRSEEDHDEDEFSRQLDALV